MESFLALGFARAKLNLLSFDRIAPSLGLPLNPKQLPIFEDEPSELARDICRSIKMASRHTPWESTCLVQAVAGKAMFKRRKLKSIICLGVKKDENGKFAAHAWLQNGNAILLGGTGYEGFTILSAYAD